MGTELTTVERSRLRTLEKVIDQGLETYVRVGMALAEVKADKLYRDDYGTWSDYCKNRWGFTQQHAGRLITASETAQRILKSEPRGSLLEAPPTENHARALSKAPPEEQAEIWEEVIFDDPNPTAAKVRDAVEKRQTKPILEAKVEPAGDPVVERAKGAVPELVRKLRFNLGNLGAGGRFDAPLAEIEEFAR